MTTSFVYKTILCLYFLTTYNICLSQSVTRHYIDSTLKRADTTYKQSRGILYVLNGIPYDSLQFDKELLGYDLKYLISLHFLSCEKPVYTHCNNDVVVLLFAYQQKSKAKRKAWKVAKELLNNLGPNSSTLLVDNILIAETSTKETFKRFQLQDVLYIDTIQIGNKHQIRIWKVK